MKASIARSSCCWPWPSDAGPRPGVVPLLAAALAVSWAAWAAGPAAAVTGTVRVELAAIRVDGPKHDRDVVIMLDRTDGVSPPPTTGRATMDQRGLVFIPHVLAVQRGTTVRFLNNDNDEHNVYFLLDETGRTLDIGTYGTGVSVDHQFTEPGEVIALCKLHLEMEAYIVVSDSPWFTAAELDPATRTAGFEVTDVPAGEYRLRAWHKTLRQLNGPVGVVVPASGRVDVPVVLTTASRAGKGG